LGTFRQRLWWHLRQWRTSMATRIARRKARHILWMMEQARSSPFATGTADGYQRGIDFYSRQDLLQSLTTLLSTYRAIGGRYPNLVSPRLYSEKINHAKYFSPIKVPESGNKLLTANFLPASLHGSVTVPEIIWHSDEPRLPENNSIAAGLYYLKASHGSGMVRRIHFPLGEVERRELEAVCGTWLSHPFGLELGEWWYNTFPRRILIETAVTTRTPSLALLFYVMNANVVRISVDEKPLAPGCPTRCLVLDENWQPLKHQESEEKRLRDFQLSDTLKQQCLAVARSIGSQFRSARIDLIIGDDGRIYLNEVTLSSSAGKPWLDRKEDQRMGRLWRGADLFDLSQAIEP